MRAVTIGAIAAAVVGLGASVATIIDDLGGVATFCAETGCETVRSSAWARPLGIPMSVLGVGFFAVMTVLAFTDRPKLRRVLAIAGGAWAVWLLVLQAFVIGAWCKLCMVADPAAIVLAVCVLAGARPIAMRFGRLAGVVSGVTASVLVLAAWTHTAKPTPAPPARDNNPAFVSAAQVKTGVTIVELVDFECPFCREMQKRVDAAIEQANVPVTLVRKMVPLAIHRGALAAALAWCCADAQGKGDAMAHALFAADPAELTPQGCEDIAARIGCDLERFRSDMPTAETRVHADLEAARAANVRGLPTLFIGDLRVTGASMTTEQLVGEIQRAAVTM
ncbi:MAG: vitamin K epoxide reductase family protein [Kofleriaceae bacterium]